MPSSDKENNTMNAASWLQGLYWFTTVFGIGVTAVDLLGLIGTDDGNGNGDSGAETEETASTSEHVPVLSILRYVRLGIYFALGFGPIGLVASETGASPLGSLTWALPGGIVSVWLARFFFRFQQRDVDSRIREEELLLERARVIVPLSNQTMGKVRVSVGQLVLERYALAEDEWETFRTDDIVEIVRVTDDCVYVQRAL